MRGIFVSGLILASAPPVSPVRHHALIEERNLCLCAVLGAERQGLPAELVAKTRTFFEKNLSWLQEALKASSNLKPAEAKRRAALIVSAVEGAMIVSQSLDDDKVFEQVADSVLSAAVK